MDQHSIRRPAGNTRGAQAPRFFSRLFAAIVVAGAAALASACGGTSGTGGEGGSTTTSGPGDCVGGVIVNGVCEGKCEASKCLADNVCVGNRCVLKCDSHRDCFADGSQSCVPSKDDETGADVNVCQPSGKPAGIGIVCPVGTECDVWLSCPDNGVCFATQCNGDPAACVADADACKGVDNCLIGKCPDGSGCRVDCAANCKPWLGCNTKGEADADAYCTKRDCMTDDECLGGYYCGVVRDPHEVCGSSPKKGDNSFCGTTSEACISLPEAGTSRFEGSLCMLRKSCLKRGAAAPCTTDLDCSMSDGLACVAFGGESRCAAKCNANNDCALDSTCDPNLHACLPKFGAWKGPPGTFCAPCQTDEDCGGAGTYWGCSDLSNGMKACFDQSFPDTCTSNADCPKSPGGKSGSCLNESFGLSPSDAEYHHCYLPVNLNTNKTSCY